MRFLDWRQLVVKIIHGNICLWLVMKESSIINAQRSTSFRMLYCVLVRFSKSTQSNDAWEQRLGWFKIFSKLQKLWQNQRWANGLRVWIFSQDSIRCSSVKKFKGLLLRLNETPQNFTGRNHLHVDIQRHLLWIKRQWKIMRVKWSTRFSICKRDLEQDNGHLLVLGSEKTWYCISEDSPQGEWDDMAERMLLEFAESGHPIFRATSPLSRGSTQKHRRWKIVDPLLCRFGNDRDYFSHNCFCKSAQSLRSSRRNVWRIRNLSRSNRGRPVVVEQSSSSLVLSVIKTEVPLDCDDVN